MYLDWASGSDIVVRRIYLSFANATSPSKEFVTKRSSTSELTKLKDMAGPRIAHATLKGPSVVKEILIGITLGLAAGSVWKMHHWNEQRKARTFYDLLEKGEISVVAEEE